MVYLGAIILALLVVWILTNAFAFLHNRMLFRVKDDYTIGDTLLIVVAHQDDEVIVAGGAMIRTLQKGGTVHVVYTTDGTRRSPGSHPQSIQGHIALREREALSCLASIGIPAENVHFFRIENQMGLRNPVVLADLHRRLAALIREVEPYAVVTSAFEGGHGDHDLTNYALAKAVVSTSFPPWRVFEAPEYNSLFLRHAFFRRVNPYLLIPFIICPLFPPCCVRGKTLEMNNDELAAKKRMFEHFQSQTPFQLIHRFGFPDQFRQLPSRDYVAEFWAWEHTWSFRLKVLLFGVGRFPTYRLSARQFEILIKMVENSAEETP